MRCLQLGSAHRYGSRLNTNGPVPIKLLVDLRWLTACNDSCGVFGGLVKWKGHLGTDEGRVDLVGVGYNALDVDSIRVLFRPRMW